MAHTAGCLQHTLDWQRVKKVESGREDKAFLTLPGTVLDRDKEKTE